MFFITVWKKTSIVNQRYSNFKGNWCSHVSDLEQFLFEDWSSQITLLVLFSVLLSDLPLGKIFELYYPYLLRCLVNHWSVTERNEYYLLSISNVYRGLWCRLWTVPCNGLIWSTIVWDALILKVFAKRFTRNRVCV